MAATPASGAEATGWARLLETTGADSAAATLVEVNRAINALDARTDTDNWHRDDFWATPGELVDRGGGDCEDFAIAKYYLLVAHGFPTDRLRLMFARVYNAGGERIEPHLVLLYQPETGAAPLVLDNLRDDILTLSRRTDLVPTAGFDADHYWRYADGRWLRVGEASVVTPWRQLRERWNRQLAADRVAANNLP